jgi:hypothetical protein
VENSKEEDESNDSNYNEKMEKSLSPNPFLSVKGSINIFFILFLIFFFFSLKLLKLQMSY